MKVTITKKKVRSLILEKEYFSVHAAFDISGETEMFDRYFREDLTLTLPVEGARERRPSLTSSRPITKVTMNLLSGEPIDLIFVHESDAQIFVEKYKEKLRSLLEALRAGAGEDRYDETVTEEI